MADEPDLTKTGVLSQGEGDTPKKLKFKIWKTLPASESRSTEEALSVFKQEGGNYRFQDGDNNHFKIGGYAYDRIINLTFGSVEEVHLALISVGDLGFKKYKPQYKYVLAKIARRKDIELCLGEEFLRARLSHHGDEADNKIYVPIGLGEDKDGNRLLLRFIRYWNSALGLGRWEYWILEGNADLGRICELDELLLVKVFNQ